MFTGKKPPEAAKPDEPQVPRLTAGAWWVLATLTCALVVSYMDRQILNLVVDPVRAELAIDDVQISLLQGTAFALLYGIAAIPLGRAVDVYSRKLILIAGVMLFSVATIASGSAESYRALFLARVCVGIGEAVVLPAGSSLLADYFPPQRRGIAFAIFFLGASLGVAISNLAGGALLALLQSDEIRSLFGQSANDAWRMLFWSMSIPSALLLLMLLTLREPERSYGTAVVAPIRAALRDLRPHAAILLPLYAAAGLNAIWGSAIMTWMPTLLSRKFALGPLEIGALLGSAGIIGGILGALSGGLIGDRVTSLWGVRGRLGASLVAATLGLAGACMGLAPSPAFTIMLFTICCASASSVGALTATAIQDLATQRTRGLVAAMLVLMTTLVGLGIGPSAVALISRQLSERTDALGASVTVVGMISVSACIGTLLLALRGAVRNRRQPAAK